MLSLRMPFDCALGTCYETWSRCSSWSRLGTGRLWKSCYDRYKILSSSHAEFKNFIDCPSNSIAWFCRLVASHTIFFPHTRFSLYCTVILFHRCKTLGYIGGSCQKCPSTCWMSDKAWQCRCYGKGSC